VDPAGFAVFTHTLSWSARRGRVLYRLRDRVVPEEPLDGYKIRYVTRRGGCPHGTHTSGTAYTGGTHARGTYSRVHTHTYDMIRFHVRYTTCDATQYRNLGGRFLSYLTLSSVLFRLPPGSPVRRRQQLAPLLSPGGGRACPEGVWSEPFARTAASRRHAGRTERMCRSADRANG
jgi:hypothetical protein